MIIIISVIGTKLQLSKNCVISEWQIPEYLTMLSSIISTSIVINNQRMYGKVLILLQSCKHSAKHKQCKELRSLPEVWIFFVIPKFLLLSWMILYDLWTFFSYCYWHYIYMHNSVSYFWEEYWLLQFLKLNGDSPIQFLKYAVFWHSQL